MIHIPTINMGVIHTPNGLDLRVIPTIDMGVIHIPTIYLGVIPQTDAFTLMISFFHSAPPPQDLKWNSPKR